MTLWTLAARGLWHYRRTHLGVVLGVAVGTAVVTGALAVGDSVRHGLRGMALAQLGKVDLALASGERLFRADLAAGLSRQLKASLAPVLQLMGTAASVEGSARAHGVQVLGVDERFFALGGCASPWAKEDAEGVVLNERLAESLGVRAGESIVLGLPKPSALSREAPLSKDEDAAVRFRVTVRAIVGEKDFGRFGLQASQVPPFNAFLSLAALQKQVNAPGRANMLLVGAGAEEESEAVTVERADAALRACWQLDDAALDLRELPAHGVLELRTSRIFLDPPVAEAAQRAAPEARGVLAYFVNELRVGGRSTPYSVVAALDEPGSEGLREGEIAVNSWLAEDLACKAGDTLELAYFVLGSQRKLEERRHAFKIKEVRALDEKSADRELMPEYPGLAQVEDCRNWEPGFPLDLKRIRDLDQAYWERYRGTPKAFVSLKTGQGLWKNRFGALTAVRFPLRPGVREAVETSLRRDLDPRTLGLAFEPVRQRLLAAGAQAQDFGQLFLGFSFFLLLAALLLLGLLFAFGIESRTAETGTLLALGFSPQQVRQLLLREGLLLSAAGSLLGLAGGMLYARAMLYGLATIWRGAVGTTGLRSHAEPVTWVLGGAAGMCVAFLVIAWGVRRQARRSASELLGAGRAGGVLEAAPLPAGRAFGLRLAMLSGIGALALVIPMGERRDEAAAAAFFSAGALLLVAGLGVCSAVFRALARADTAGRLTASALSLRNAARRRGRSLASVGLLASGSFLVAGVGAQRHEGGADLARRNSGTGGFALFAESTLPVHDDLNSTAGREVYTLEPEEMQGVSVVPLRLRDGDDASCLNLNRAQTPRLLGVRPELLADRGAFAFEGVPAAATDSTGNSAGWRLLNGKAGEDEVLAVADKNTLEWGLHLSVGESLPYTDERGKAFRIRIVGALSSSILQGALIVPEDAFMARFPSESGSRVFLIDAPAGNREDFSRTLSRKLEDVGLAVIPPERRLAEFQAVENTYLSAFQALGGLGLLLGSLGLGVLVFRNVLERRGELALLRAVGYRRRTLVGLLFGEHALLWLMGLGCGVAAAGLASLPALRAPSSGAPWASLAVTLGAVLLSGALWAWLASALALRGPWREALRESEA